MSHVSSGLRHWWRHCSRVMPLASMGEVSAPPASDGLVCGEPRPADDEGAHDAGDCAAVQAKQAAADAQDVPRRINGCDSVLHVQRPPLHRSLHRVQREAQQPRGGATQP